MHDKDTKIKGNITELDVLTYMTKLGYQVSIPFGDRARYDQIWDIHGKLLRVQIKTSKLSDDETKIDIPCKSTTRSQGKHVNKRYTSDEIDGLATIYNGVCYYIPIDILPSKCISLRFSEPLNNCQNIHFASDFEVEKQLINI